MDFGEVPAVLLSMLLIAVIGVAIFLALSGMQANFVSGATRCGTNSTGGTSGTIWYDNCGEGYNSTQQITVGVGNIFDLSPTWGTLIGVGVLIGIVAGFLLIGAAGYVYGRRKGYF